MNTEIDQSRSGPSQAKESGYQSHALERICALLQGQVHGVEPSQINCQVPTQVNTQHGEGKHRVLQSEGTKVRRVPQGSSGDWRCGRLHVSPKPVATMGRKVRVLGSRRSVRDALGPGSSIVRTLQGENLMLMGPCR